LHKILSIRNAGFLAISHGGDPATWMNATTGFSSFCKHYLRLV